MKLISMTDFVLNPPKTGCFEVQSIMHQNSNLLRRFRNYANFLKQPLTLGMFVPCDEEGNVFNDFDDDLLEMVNEKGSSVFADDMIELAKQYQAAQSRVLFEGLDLKRENGFNCLYWLFAKINIIGSEFVAKKEGNEMILRTIEDLAGLEITISPNAQKMING